MSTVKVNDFIRGPERELRISGTYCGLRLSVHKGGEGLAFIEVADRHLSLDRACTIVLRDALTVLLGE